MIAWSTKRQIAYLSIPLFLIVAILTFVFFHYVYSAPSCFDNKKDGDETGIDCGGGCKLICTSDSIDPIVLWSKVFRVTDTVWSTAAYVQNPNITATAAKVPYIFTIFNEQNKVLQTRNGVIDIPKNKKFVVFESGYVFASTSLDARPKRAQFAFDPGFTWNKSTEVAPELSISQSSLLNEKISPKITGKIKNDSNNFISKVELIALVSDQSQKAVGVSRTVVEDLDAGTSLPFSFSWAKPFEANQQICEQPSEIMLAIDRSGSMASLGGSPVEPLASVKNTAISFVDRLHDRDKVGLISFATKASDPLDSTLTANTLDVKNMISRINISASSNDKDTNLADAISKAQNELSQSTSTEVAKKVIILLTDGTPTEPKKAGDLEYPTTLAKKAAVDAIAKGTLIYTIGLGKSVNNTLLTDISGSALRYFSAPKTEDLSKIYDQIATNLCTQKPAVIEIFSRILK